MRSRVWFLAAATVAALAMMACGGGDNAAAPADAGGAVVVQAGDNYFSVKGKKRPNIVVTAGSDVQMTIVNKGKAIHNLRLAGPDGVFDTPDDIVAQPAHINPGSQASVTFKVTQTGAFPFRCDLHPESTGTITVKL